MAELSANAEKVANFLKSHPKVADKIVKNFGELPNSIISRIADHLSLFEYYCNKDGLKFDSRLKSLDAAKEDSVIIYFVELNLYGVYTEKEYLHFCKNSSDRLDDGMSMTLKQLILTSQKQKLIFICSDWKFHEKLSNYSKKCFGDDVKTSVVDDEITIGVICKNFTEVEKKYAELMKFIIDNDEMCAESIKPKLVYSLREHRFILSLINKITRLDINVDSDMIVDKLLSGAQIVGNCNFIISNNGANTLRAGTKNTISPKEYAKLWIDNNPPEVKEVTTNYYNRYSHSIENPLHFTRFGPIVKKRGYSIIQSNGIRYWII